ncbi:hypothetical protein Tco_1443921 [Tanacetum coccineum]
MVGLLFNRFRGDNVHFILVLLEQGLTSQEQHTLGVAKGPVTQTVITHNTAYQADDLDAYDSDCDEISTAKAVLMANLSSYDSNVLFEVVDAVFIRGFYKKFYNSLDIVPNRCSSSIGKTQGLLSFSRRIGWEGLITV